MEKEIIALKQLSKLIQGSKWENHVFLVGGGVRDSIMGLPIKDIDLCINLPNGGIDFANWIHTNTKISQVVTYPNYGTAMFHLPIDGENDETVQIECVQTRKEQYHDNNSRNPETAYGTLEEDCYRRDLTINSLYRNISTDEIIDITGKGLNDIENHIIRTPCDPDITFSDDPLRMLRVIRFSSRYGWDIDENTLQGIIKNAKRIEIISQERIMDEFSKILVSPNPSKGLRLMESTLLLSYIIPEACEMVNMEQNEYHFGTVWEHTLAVVEKTQPILENRLAGFFHDIGKIKTRTISEEGKIQFIGHELVSSDLIDEILKRMKYPNNMIKRIKKAVINHMRTKNYGDTLNTKEKTIRKLQYILGNCFDLALDLIDADNKSHAVEHCLPNQVRLIRELTDEMVKNGTDCFKIQLPINGDCIMKFKGISSGVEVKKYLEFLKKLYLANPKITKEYCLTHIKNHKC